LIVEPMEPQKPGQIPKAPQPQKPAQPTGLYLLVVTKAPDPDAVAQIIAQRIELPFDKVRKLVAMAPATVAENLTPLVAEDIAGAIRSIGGGAEKRLIPSSLPCPIHKDQRGRGVCQVCGKAICALCIKEAKGSPICPECTGEATKIKIPFPWFRLVLIILLIGSAVTAYFVITRERAKFAWDRPYKLAVVGFMQELPPEWRTFIEQFDQDTGGQYVDLKNHTLPDMTGWFQREYQRYGGALKMPVNLTIFGPYDVSQPPPPPTIEGNFFDRYLKYREFLTYFKNFNKEHQLNLDGYDGVVYVQFVQGKFDGFLESYASRRDRLGLANCYLDPSLVETDIMIVMHEFTHLLNAKDHYDAQTLPVYPQGYVQPFEEPLYPQKYAELMAGRIPVDQSNAKEIAALRDLRLGIYTANEIGWITDEQLKKFIEEKKSPPPD